VVSAVGGSVEPGVVDDWVGAKLQLCKFQHFCCVAKVSRSHSCCVAKVAESPRADGIFP